MGLHLDLETVWNRHFHWLIWYPGVGVFSEQKKSDSLGGRCAGKNACCALLRAQATACARSETRKYIILLSCVFSPFVYFFCRFFLCLTHLFFSWSFLLWFCVVVSAGFSLSFPLSTVFCLLFKHCICNALPFCFLSVGLSRLLIC